MTKTIFITGTSSGLGKTTAIHFAKQGWNVAATMRAPEKETELTQYENVKIFKMDVTNVEQVAETTAQAIAAFGKIDVVVNNAGLGAHGALELVGEKALDGQYNTNVRGPINVIRAFIPHFRANHGGKFINISSYMGFLTALPMSSLYNMSKFALEGLTEALYYELKPFNIDLHLIEPGAFNGNNYVDNVIWAEGTDIKNYDNLTTKVRDQLASFKNNPSLTEPQTIADQIFAVATGENTNFRVPVGEDTQELMAVRDSLPIKEYLEQKNAMFQ
ncbi:SDR family oxidoreductase [Pedobacter hartonius]|uniref:NAD(P)-dependent dehydrogenase, short-chain alcohol dehydrogenase family n=1 Tax=Pedobacter hartonius TaxID=425514 RepID=A0A1H4HBM3_9SPHI|nr:SDR family oxidoreductase [Pedobacter hartonius]SEB18468.1 NAD(P)-dependent dehydrogenase, short-chain alcohol dehydrogenase family [Pedobacter hartonius]